MHNSWQVGYMKLHRQLSRMCNPSKDGWVPAAFNSTGWHKTKHCNDSCQPIRIPHFWHGGMYVVIARKLLRPTAVCVDMWIKNTEWFATVSEMWTSDWHKLLQCLVLCQPAELNSAGTQLFLLHMIIKNTLNTTVTLQEHCFCHKLAYPLVQE